MESGNSSTGNNKKFKSEDSDDLEYRRSIFFTSNKHFYFHV